MSSKLKKVIALLAVFSLVFASIPMNVGTIKAHADDWRATYTPVRTITLPEDLKIFYDNEDWNNYQNDQTGRDDPFYYESVTIKETSAATGGAIKIDRRFAVKNLTIEEDAVVDVVEGYSYNEDTKEENYWANQIIIVNDGTLKLDGTLRFNANDENAGGWRLDEDGEFELDEENNQIWDHWFNELTFSNNSSLIVGTKGSLIFEDSFLHINDDSVAEFNISGDVQLNGESELVVFPYSTLSIYNGTINVNSSRVGTGGYSTLIIDKNGKLILDEDSEFNLGEGENEINPTLKVGKTGTVIFAMDSEENLYSVGSAQGAKIEIEEGGIIKSASSKSGTTRFNTRSFISLKLGSEYFSLTAEFGGEKHPIVFDGEYSFDWQSFLIDKNGNWDVNGEPAWYGEPFEGEYKLYTNDESGVVTINGTEVSYREYYSFEKGKTLNFKLTPPAGSTATPIVSIIIPEEYTESFYRSDSLKASDYDYDSMEVAPYTEIDTLKKITLTNNEFSFTPESDDPISITIYWKPSDALTSGIEDIYGQYRWMYDLQNKKWVADPYEGWADPGKEFAVEASATGSGDVALTPGFGFYRLGNTVGESYQGGELAKGGVNVTFTPASGYELNTVMVDGIAVSLSSLTKRGDSYIYNIAKLPEIISKYYSFTTRVDGTNALLKAFLPNGVPVITVEGIFTAVSSPVIITPDPVITSTPAISTPEPATPTPAPEVKVETEKKDDGTEVKTTVTTNTDGSKETETETVNADGTKEIETVIENKDGSVRTETVELDAKGNVLSKTEEEVSVSSRGTEIVETKIENADGSSKESVVKTTKEGKVVSETVEIAANGDLSITLETDKTDGSEVVKTFEKADDDGIKLTDYETNGNTAVIPGEIKVGDTSYTVTTIGKKAMAGNTDIKKVKIPESITTIGKGAFQNAKNLKKIELGSEITKVSKNAFAGIAKNAVIRIKASVEDFERIVALIRKSGVDSNVKFKRIKPD